MRVMLDQKMNSTYAQFQSLFFDLPIVDNSPKEMQNLEAYHQYMMSQMSFNLTEMFLKGLKSHLNMKHKKIESLNMKRVSLSVARIFGSDLLKSPKVKPALAVALDKINKQKRLSKNDINECLARVEDINILPYTVHSR